METPLWLLYVSKPSTLLSANVSYSYKDPAAHAFL